MKGLIVFLLCIFFLGCSPAVEPGQVWRWEYGADNPFGGPHIKYYEVLDVQNGWVKYREYSLKEEVDSKYEYSRRISWFKIGSKLQEETK